VSANIYAKLPVVDAIMAKMISGKGTQNVNIGYARMITAIREGGGRPNHPIHLSDLEVFEEQKPLWYHLA
jgi:hypothetical protein